MKVLLLNQVFYPDRVATAQHVTDLARFIQANGCEVTVLTGRRDYEKRHIQYPAYEEMDGIRIIRAASTRFGKSSLAGRVIDAITLELSFLWKLVWHPHVDVTITFTSPPLLGLLGYFFSRVKGGKFVQWLMDVNTDTAAEVGYISKGSLLYKSINALFEFTLRKSDQIVVLDRWMKLKMIRHGADPRKLVVVPPWPVNKLNFDDEQVLKKKENAFVREHGLESKCVILYSGNHSIVHPLETLLEAARALKNDSRFVFVFIGAGIRVKDVSDYIDKYELDNVIQLPIQPREKLEQTLSAADLHAVVMGQQVSGLVHTSKIYGVLATGKPYVFIGPKESHVVDLIEKCPYGYHVEHGDIRGLVELIRKVPSLTAEEKREVQVHNREYVRLHYDPEKCMGTFMKQVIREPIGGFFKDPTNEFA